MVFRRRPRGRKPLRRRRYGRPLVRRGAYRRLGLRNTHLIKRLGQQVVINLNNLGQPTLPYNGNGTVGVSPAVAGVTPNTVQFGGAMDFRLNAVSDYVDITQLFDRYMITGVKLKFLYQSNIADTAGPTTLPCMWYAQDFDDSSLPVNQLDVAVKQYCKTKILNANRQFSLYIKPRITKAIAGQTGAGPVVIADTSEKPCYLDCAFPNVPHYGLKFWIDNWYNQAPNESNVVLRIQPTYYLKLKDAQ